MNEIQKVGQTGQISTQAQQNGKSLKPNLKYEADSVSFSSKKQQSKTIMDKVLGFFGVKKETNISSIEADSVDKVWLSADGVTSQDAQSELAQKLRSMTYVTDTKMYDNVTMKMYNEPAIKTIVKYSKQDPEFGEKLAEIFQHASYSSVEDLEMIAKQLQDTPDLVEKFYARSFATPESLATFLKAHKINPDISMRIFDLAKQDGSPKYYAYDTYSLTEAATKIGTEPILKYAGDSRMHLYADDVIDLAKLDAINPKEINDFIEFISKNNLLDGVRPERVSKLMEVYLTDSKATNELIQKGVLRKSLISEYTPAYKDIPEFVSLILDKNKIDSRMGFQVHEVPAYAYKAKQYQKTIGEITGQGFDGLNASQLKKIIDTIEQSAKQLDTILKQAF